MQRGQRALDVGCGPGALTAPLVERLGADAVAAVDPSEHFVAAVHSGCPRSTCNVLRPSSCRIPDDSFDLALAQLVVHFMTDPVAGLVEMARVTRPGGVVAACVWDHASGGDRCRCSGVAVRDLDPHGRATSPASPARGRAIWRSCSTAPDCRGIEATSLTVHVRYATFLEWWEPFTLGVGPAGDYVAGAR